MIYEQIRSGWRRSVMQGRTWLIPAETVVDDYVALLVRGAEASWDLAPAAPGPDTAGLAAPPAPALGAVGLGVADRVERLLFPPGSARLRLAGVLAGLSAAAVVAAALVIPQSPLCSTVPI